MESSVLDQALELPEIQQALQDGYLTRPPDAWTRPAHSWETVQILHLGLCRQRKRPFVELVQSSDGTSGIMFSNADQPRAYSVDQDAFLALLKKHGLHGLACQDSAFPGFRSCETRDVVEGFVRCLTKEQPNREWYWEV